MVDGKVGAGSVSCMLSGPVARGADVVVCVMHKKGRIDYRLMDNIFRSANLVN